MKSCILEHSLADGWKTGDLPSMDGESTLVLCFGARAYAERSDAIDELREAFPRSVVVGCSTSGEIAGDRVEDDSLVVGVLAFEKTRLARAVAKCPDPAMSEEAGRSIADQLRADDLRSVLVFSDGLTVNGTSLVRGLNEALSTLEQEIVISGGLAGDGDRFESTWVLSGGELSSGTVTAVGFYGDALRVGHGSRGGWDIFGPERTITRSEGNVLLELDGKPALDLYKTYLGDRVSGLPATALLFPLAIRDTDDKSAQLTRTILAVDDDANSMTFAGDMPEGWRAQLMKANFDRLVEGAADAAALTFERLDGSTAPFVIAISCVGRRLVLAQRVEDELEASLEAFPPGTSQIGFYSYGELSPLADGACELHNQTMTLTSYTEVL